MFICDDYTLTKTERYCTTSNILFSKIQATDNKSEISNDEIYQQT